MTEPTPRQIQVLVAWFECGTSEDAGLRLGLHAAHIRKVLGDLHAVYGVRTSAQAFACAVRDGLIDVHKLDLRHCA